MATAATRASLNIQLKAGMADAVGALSVAVLHAPRSTTWSTEVGSVCCTAAEPFKAAKTPAMPLPLPVAAGAFVRVDLGARLHHRARCIQHRAQLLIAAVMIVLLVPFIMGLRRSSTLLHLLACAGLFWSVFMFALTFADYATRRY